MHYSSVTETRCYFAMFAGVLEFDTCVPCTSYALSRYEDLIKHRASVVTRVLDKCGMLTASSSLDSEATAKVFDEDAHAGKNHYPAGIFNSRIRVTCYGPCIRVRLQPIHVSVWGFGSKAASIVLTCAHSNDVTRAGSSTASARRSSKKDGPVFMQKADVEALNTLIGTHKELTAIDFILPQTEKDY